MTHQEFTKSLVKHNNIFDKRHPKPGNLFANPKLTRQDFVSSMHACGLGLGQNISVGKEW